MPENARFLIKKAENRAKIKKIRAKMGQNKNARMRVTQAFLKYNEGYYLTLSTYSPVLAFTLINSPSFTNKGTFTVAPVSTVAGFSVRVAVSPFIPGSL